MSNAIPNITLIKAGAGAGKTHKIQSTLTEWIEKDKVKADRVLAVTFTNAAASEMRQRIKLALLNSGQTEQAALLQQSVITTIHSFGLKVLERFAFEEGLSPSPSQLDENEEEFLLAEVLSELQEVVNLIDNAAQFGYTGSTQGDEYKEKYQLIQKNVLRVIHTLRSIGKDTLENNSQNIADQINSIVVQAKQALSNVYGAVGDEQSINNALISAVSNARKLLPPSEKLMNDWGKGNNDLVNALFRINLENVTEDWSKWVKLQTLGAPTKIYGSKSKPGNEEHIHLVEAILAAANGLSKHPRPLQEAQEHVELLLNAALSASQRYQDNKREAGLVDYADMVGLAYSILHSDSWLTEIAEEFDCLIIDEFQDTNPLQFALLYRLHEKGVPVFVVGDLKQAIMGFQGADSRLLARLLKQYANTPNAVQELPNNWRSTAELMTFINAMGQQLYGTEYSALTPMVTTKSDLQPVRVLNFDPEEWIASANAKSKKPCYTQEGYQMIANEIVSLHNPINGKHTQVIDKHTNEKRNIRPSDIAVLAKSNSKLIRFAEVLRSNGVNVQMQQEGFLECPAVTLLLDALQAVNNTNDQFAWTSLITSPLLTAKPAEELSGILQSALETLQDPEQPAWQSFKHPLKEELSKVCKGAIQKPLVAQFQAIIDALDFLEVVKAFPEHAQYRTNTLKLMQLAEQFEQQSELSLNALGIVGKHGQSFQAWLAKASALVKHQPLANPVATDAVVLSTWHRSKGLEWPVVVVLQAEDVPTVRLPSIAVEYKDSADEDAADLLENSSVQILTSFADKDVKQRMVDDRQTEADDTAKNLYYVALTRAREQLIVPVLESKPKKGDEESNKSGMLYEFLLPVVDKLTADGKTDIATVESMNATKNVVTAVMLEKAAAETYIQIKLADGEQASVKPVAHTITPSQHSESPANIKLTEAQQHSYQPAFNLDNLGYTGPANELGTWMHRIYQVCLLKPELLARALVMQPCVVTDEAVQHAIEQHVQGFKESLEALCGGIKNLYSEVPVTGLNKQGQVISGVIDLLVEDTNGSWWIIDHKTDQEAISKGYWEQLEAYRQILAEGREVAGVVLNWIRHGAMNVRN